MPKQTSNEPGAEVIDLALIRMLTTHVHDDAPWDPFDRPAPEVRRAPEHIRGFRVRIDLMDAKPPIWRRLVLRGDTRLDELHTILQVAMGWENCHLHRFGIGTDQRSLAYFLTEFDVSEGDVGIDERAIRLDQTVSSTGDRLFYEYDFGDGWDHLLVVEEVLDDQPPGPKCLKGKMACPPEDCGGLGGYDELADWVRSGCNPKAKIQGLSAKEMLAWLPPRWHPDHFSVDETNDALAKLN